MSTTGQEDITTEHVSAKRDLLKGQIKRATRTRKIFALLTSFSLFLSVIFLILVGVGGTNTSFVRTRSYFLNLNLSEILPFSGPNAPLLNSVARTLGLHDYYRVYLQGICHGYKAGGLIYCSDQKTICYFSPAEIRRNELLAGVSGSFISVNAVAVG